MQEPIYTTYPDGIEYASFGGHLRTREYVENWPFVEDDGKNEVFALDSYLPYSLHPFFAAYLPSIGCSTVTDVQERVTNKDAVTLQIDLSPNPLDCGSDAAHFARYLRTCIELGVAVEQIMKMVYEAVRVEVFEAVGEAGTKR